MGNTYTRSPRRVVVNGTTVIRYRNDNSRHPHLKKPIPSPLLLRRIPENPAPAVMQILAAEDIRFRGDQKILAAIFALISHGKRFRGVFYSRSMISFSLVCFFQPNISSRFAWRSLKKLRDVFIVCELSTSNGSTNQKYISRERTTDNVRLNAILWRNIASSFIAVLNDYCYRILHDSWQVLMR